MGRPTSCARFTGSFTTSVRKRPGSKMALNWGKFGELGRWAGWMSPPVVSQREGYALWADTYPPHAHNPLMQAEQSAVTTMLAALTPHRALDAGTGTGRNLPLLASAGARLIVGADMSLPMLEHRQCRTPRVCG